MPNLSFPTHDETLDRQRLQAQAVVARGGLVATQLRIEQQIAEEQRKTVKSNLHLSATAPMGNESDPIAVVDACGKVFGIAGLFVVDASLFPDVPSQATNPDAIMAAEYLASRFSGA